MATRANVSNGEVELRPLHSHMMGKRDGERRRGGVDGEEGPKKGDRQIKTE